MACNSGVTLVTVPSSDKFPVQFQGSAFAQKVLRLFGWQYAFLGLPEQQGVIIGYPHTSNWDFIVMVLVKWATGLQIQFLAKDSLFHYPLFSPWLRKLGGIPIDRSSKNGVVGDMLALFAKAKTREPTFGLHFHQKAHANLPKVGAVVFTNLLGKPMCLCVQCVSITVKTVDFRVACV